MKIKLTALLFLYLFFTQPLYADYDEMKKALEDYRPPDLFMSFLESEAKPRPETKLGSVLKPNSTTKENAFFYSIPYSGIEKRP